MDTARFFEHVFGRVPLEYVSPAWFMGLVHLRLPVYARWWKRAFVVAAAIVGVLVLPLVPVIALLVRASGPVLYRQTRLGSAASRSRSSSSARWGSTQKRTGARSGRAAVDSAGDIRRPRAPAAPPGRATPALERGEGRDVHRRPQARTPRVRRAARAASPLLEPAAARAAGHHRLGSGAIGLRGRPCETAEKLSYDLWYLRHRNLAVDVAICVRTASLVLRSALPEGLRAAGGSPLERRFPAAILVLAPARSARAGNATTPRSPGASPCRSWSCPSHGPRGATHRHVPRRPGVDVHQADRGPAPPVADEHRPRAREVRRAGPFSNRNGHRLFARRVARTVLTAG